MALADTIVVLEDGRVVETGSPAVLAQGDGYLSGLGPRPSESDEIADVEPTRDVRDQSDSPSTGVDNSISDLRRKNGEMSVYSYYLTSAGYGAVALYTFFMVMWIFCTEFSSEFAPALPH